MNIECGTCDNYYPESFIHEIHDNRGIPVEWVCENCMEEE